MFSTELLWFIVAIGAVIGCLMIYLIYDTVIKNVIKCEKNDEKDEYWKNTNRNGGKWF